jgi:hypothetical protein
LLVCVQACFLEWARYLEQATTGGKHGSPMPLHNSGEIMMGVKV